MKTFFIIYAIFLINFLCSAETIYPLICKVDNEEVPAKLYIGLNVVEYKEGAKNDALFRHYLSAYQRKSVDDLDKLYSEELARLNKKEWQSYLNGLKVGHPIEYLKYHFNGYCIYNYISDTSYKTSIALRKKDDNARFTFIYKVHPYFSQFISPTQSGILKNEIHPVKIDTSKMSSISYGSNDMAKVYFKFLDHEDELTLELQRLTESFSKAYKNNDLDVLSTIATKTTMGTVLLELQAGYTNQLSTSLKPVGVLDMDPIYIYLGRSKDGGFFYRKYIKQGGNYYIFNYNAITLVIENICSSDEFKDFVNNKYKEAYFNNLSSERTQPVKKSGFL